MFIIPRVIDGKRRRKIKGSFGWIDHRLLTGGYLLDMRRSEILLYYFLVTAADRNGVSFYKAETIKRLLKLDLWEIREAREGLVNSEMILYKDHLYQVLDLPDMKEGG